MKENGMNKLINLLNEYSHTDFVKYEDGCFVEKYGGEGIWYSDVEVISKDFGFIQWLIQNDKIDFYKDKYGMNFYENGVQKFLKSEEEIVMELSIQESPIEYLISILK